MGMPAGPKDAKPKADNIGKDDKGGGLDGMKLVIVNTVTTMLVCILFIGVNYFVQTSFLSEKFAAIMAVVDKGEEEEHEDAVERGLILDLGDFVLNLTDVSPRRYLKVNVAIELTKKHGDPDPNKPPEPAGGHGGGHGGHGGGAPAVDPMKQIEMEMNQFKPAIRDVVISTLSSKAADEISSIAGKELSKEQIKEAVDAIFAGEREVLRVSFGNFIIQ